MIKFSEFVSLGHPDKIADYISQYLLDRYIEKDPQTRYAVEVQIKDWQVTLGGEVSSQQKFTPKEIQQFVREAVNDIGYTYEYMERWGADNTICGDLLEVTSLISQQSGDIAQGLNGWGDQGIFFGYCEHRPDTCGMPIDHTLAKCLCKVLFESGVGGLDIKTQIVTRDDQVKKVIVAIPLMNDESKTDVLKLIRSTIRGRYEVIINGTGKYIKHSSIADCGTTGRKLAVDFYGGNCKLGGGSPWTKDASKADLTLNLAARCLAIKYAEQHKVDVTASLACCIGKQEVDFTINDSAGNTLAAGELTMNPQELREEFKLNTPIYASMCRWGLFGEYQQDKEWEKW
ncbi:MAG: methionine adenosyltransferase domain-containing protein [Bacteroidales bacterium]